LHQSLGSVLLKNDMKLQYIGGTCNNQLEWFWDFNRKMIAMLEENGYEMSAVPKVNPISKNPSGWPLHDLFGHKTALNANNLLIANPKTEKALLFTTFFDLRMLCGKYCDLPTDNMVQIYSGHFDEAIVAEDGPVFKKIIKPWFFRPWNREGGYIENSYKPKNKNLFFRGINIPRIRACAEQLQELGIPEVDVRFAKTNRNAYCKMLVEAGVCFSLSGIRDMCNRDIEYWRAGVPFIRPRFTSKLIVDIPDEVYFPVEWESTMQRQRTPVPVDPKQLAIDVIEKYKEIIDNKKLLKKIADNGYDFYKKHFTTENIVKESFKLLQKSNILSND